MGIGFGSDRVGFQIAELSTALVAGVGYLLSLLQQGTHEAMRGR